MLRHLKVRNYALIRQLEMQCHSGLSIITGETGAGKSILLGALGLILGKRADTSALLEDSQKCVVEGFFDVSELNLQAFFEQQELDYEPETILRREITPSGKSRAFINDTPVKLNVLREVGERLVDIHSQHQTLRLQDENFRLQIIDDFAGNADVVKDYRQFFAGFQRLQKKFTKLQEQEAAALRDSDYFSFQLDELNAANLSAGEDKELADELNVLSNAEAISQSLSQIEYLLYEEESAIAQRLAEAAKLLAPLSHFSADLKNLQERLQSLSIEAKDVYSEAGHYRSNIVVDEERLQEVNDRLQLLHKLLKKHNAQDTEELLTIQKSLQEKLDSATSVTDELKQTEKELEQQQQELQKKAAALTAKRKQHIPELEKNLTNLLRQVGIPEAVIRIDVQPLESPAEFGADSINILFSANKGLPPGPVGTVASGGELSRIMLCLKYLLAGSLGLPTMIFDEIDTGVSGEVARKVAEIIRQLSQKHQVLVITHLPQMAALGAHHYKVFKEAGEDFTETRIAPLAPDDRLQEIAQMIAGSQPGEAALQNARELMARK